MRSFRWLRPFLFFCALIYSTPSHAGFFMDVSVGYPPPPLPLYEQPICPGPDFIWTPGYWAFDPDIDDYYWVPGTWVLAPVIGYLWTPGYWGWGDGYYVWHTGYWGPHVGFYGGINYGFGYFGEGYRGGYWNNGAFVYNTAVNNVNTNGIHNTYDEKVALNHTTVNNVSFNGGRGGTTAQPTPQEKLAATEEHAGLTQLQAEHEHVASRDRDLRASFNHGKPSIAATTHASMFTGEGLVPANGFSTAPKNLRTSGNRGRRVTSSRSWQARHPANGIGTFAHVAPNGLSPSPRNIGVAPYPGLGVSPPGSFYARHSATAPRAFAHLSSGPGRMMGASGRSFFGPQIYRARPRGSPPPRQHH